MIRQYFRFSVRLDENRSNFHHSSFSATDYNLFIYIFLNKTVLFTHCGGISNKTEIKTIALIIEKEELNLLTYLRVD